MTTNLMNAHREWASRPADERFTSLQDMHDALVARAKDSRDTHAYLTHLVPNVNGKIVLTGDSMSAALTHWSTGQFLSKLGIGRDLIGKLTPSIANAVISDRLSKFVREEGGEDKQRILVDLHRRDGGDATIRAFHGRTYSRLWDHEVTKTLIEYLPAGWTNPMAYAGGKWGAQLVPSGLYAGDRNMFAMLTNAKAPFEVNGEEFHRGLFVGNSEVGSDTMYFTPFMFRYYCCNNIVWGATQIVKFKGMHRGDAARNTLYALRRFLATLNDNQDVRAFEQAVEAAKNRPVVEITKDRDSTFEKAVEKFKGKFTSTQVAGAMDAILREEKDATGTAWDWLQGFTAMARVMPNADDRADIERTASKLLLVATK